MRRGSIARLMTAVGLSALAFLLLREWIGPFNLFGFLGLFGLWITVIVVAWLLTSGATARFFAGAGFTGLALWIAVFLSGYSILDLLRERLILPADRLIHRGAAQTRIEFQFLQESWGLMRHHDYVASPRWFTVRADLYRWHPELQALLLIPMVILSAIGGLIALRLRPRRTSPSTPADPT